MFLKTLDCSVETIAHFVVAFVDFHAVLLSRLRSGNIVAWRAGGMCVLLSIQSWGNLVAHSLQLFITAVRLTQEM